MNTTVSALIVISILAVALWLVIRWFVRSSSRYRGTHVVTCPETKAPAIVSVDALHASLTSTVGPPDIRLESCSRWPIKQECGQECLTSLEVAPESCLVSGVLMRWYRDKNCVYCHKEFSEIQWLDHRPALLNPQGKLVTWNECDIKHLENVLETHLPVCWDCYIAQSFRLEHPDLVVFRPGRNATSEHPHGPRAM